jgi:hypothetical protein
VLRYYPFRPQPFSSSTKVKVANEICGTESMKTVNRLAKKVPGQKVGRTVTLLIASGYWVSGLCPSFGIVNIGKLNVSENGFLSILR